MSRQSTQPSPEAKDTLRALRRAAKNALELGLRTGTPVWVVRDSKLVDLTKEYSPSKKSSKRVSQKTGTRKSGRVKTTR